jgi:preprotein translocase subunit SecD
MPKDLDVARAIVEALPILRERLANYGISGSAIEAEGQSRISATVYGDFDAKHIEALLMMRGQFAFKKIDFDDNRLIEEMESGKGDISARIPDGYQVLKLSGFIENGFPYKHMLVNSPTILNRLSIIELELTDVANPETPRIKLILSDEGISLYDVFSRANSGYSLAFLVDNEVFTWAQVEASNSSRVSEIFISGFTRDDARLVYSLMKSAALPCHLVILEKALGDSGRPRPLDPSQEQKD